MEIQVVRRAVRRFEDGEILPLQMRVPLRAAIDGEQKRQVGIVGIERPLLAEIELPVAGDRGEERIEQVVAFLVEQAVMLREQLLKLGDGVLHLHAVLVVDHDGQRELAEVLALHAHRGQRAAQLRDGGGFGVIDQIRPAGRCSAGPGDSRQSWSWSCGGAGGARRSLSAPSRYRPDATR